MASVFSFFGSNELIDFGKRSERKANVARENMERCTTPQLANVRYVKFYCNHQYLLESPRCVAIHRYSKKETNKCFPYNISSTDDPYRHPTEGL